MSSTLYNIIIGVCAAVVGIIAFADEFPKIKTLRFIKLYKVIIFLLATIIGILATVKKDSKTELENANTNAKNAYKIIDSIGKYLEMEKKTLKEGIDRNMQLSDSAKTTIKELKQTVTYLNDSVEYNLGRISRPIKDIYFSYCIIYDSADFRFPKYYKRILNTQKVINTNTQTLLINPSDSTRLPREHEDLTDELITPSVLIQICSPSSNPKLDYRTTDLCYSAIGGNKQVDYSKTQYAELFHTNLYKKSIVSYIIDFEKKQIKVYTYYTVVSEIQNNETVLSEIDLIKPHNIQKRTIYLQIMHNQKFSLPKLESFVIQFGKVLNHDYLYFDGKKFRKHIDKLETYQTPDNQFLYCNLSDGKYISY